ncbi:MAG: ABC transporter substrate-binding protein [Actinomycetota bacterium]
MDFKKLDAHRRRVGAVQNDLIDAYADGRINRRDFVRRGTILGLSAPFLGGVLAACGDDDETTDSSGDTGDSGAAPAAGGDLLAGIQFGDANSGLDPLNMLDLGTYSVLSQSFEYLVGLGPDGNIAATSLATGWTPNDDGTAWTFNLREGVTWQDGTPFTSADVAATIDRMVVAGAGLAGIVSEGAVETPDDVTAVVNLDKANGNLPVLVSIFNPQSLITPTDYSDGTTLDARPAGTGAWILDGFDANTFEARFSPNPNWWGGAINLDSVTLSGFESSGTAVAAMASGEIDVIQNFSVVDGTSLLNSDDFTVITPPSANHRQLWFNTQLPAGGPWTDPRVRQAIGYCLDRQQMVDTLFEGQAIVANDHPIYPTLPFFDDSATPQRPRDIEMARQLLSDAGFPDGLSDTLQVGDIAEVPDLAAIVQQNCAEAGINLEVNVTPNSDFYGEFWCTGASWGSQPETGGPGVPCGASAGIGIVDYGHRPVPDIYLTRALQTDGDWNSSNYADADYDALVTEYQGAIDVDGQKSAIGQIQQKLHADGPAMYPFFFNYLGGHSSSVSGVQMTALGHMQFQKATKA